MRLGFDVLSLFLGLPDLYVLLLLSLIALYGLYGLGDGIFLALFAAAADWTVLLFN